GAHFRRRTVAAPGTLERNPDGRSSYGGRPARRAARPGPRDAEDPARAAQPRIVRVGGRPARGRDGSRGRGPWLSARGRRGPERRGDARQLARAGSARLRPAGTKVAPR